MMINIDETKLAAIRKYWREICMIAMVYAIVFLFQRNASLNAQIFDMQEKQISKGEAEVVKKDGEAKFWRDAFITTSKYNKYLEKRKDSL